MVSQEWVMRWEKIFIWQLCISYNFFSTSCVLWFFHFYCLSFFLFFAGLSQDARLLKWHVTRQWPAGGGHVFQELRVDVHVIRIRGDTKSQCNGPSRYSLNPLMAIVLFFYTNLCLIPWKPHFRFTNFIYLLILSTWNESFFIKYIWHGRVYL